MQIDNGFQLNLLHFVCYNTYYSEWYKRYPVALKNFNNYVENDDSLGEFSWNLTDENNGLTDPDNYSNKKP